MYVEKYTVPALQAVCNALIGAKAFPTEVTDYSGVTPVMNNGVLTRINLDATTTSDGVTTWDNIVDPRILTDIGSAINSNQDIYDLVFNTLVDVMGKFVVDTRVIKADIPDIWVDPLEWGGFVEMVRVGLADMMDDPMWNPMVNGGYPNFSDADLGGNYPSGYEYGSMIAAMEHATYKPKVQAKKYNKSHPVVIGLTKTPDVLFTAFNGFDQFNAFMTALENSVLNTIEMKTKAFAQNTVVTAIGAAGGLGHIYNLRTLYNSETGASISSAAEFRASKDAMTWAAMFIKNTRDNFRQFSTAFNDGKIPAATPEEDIKLLLNSQFSNAMKFVVKANTYNDELIGMGDYKTTPCWQGINLTGGNSFEWDAVTRVYLEHDAASDFGFDVTGLGAKEPVVLKNVLGIMYDKYALGLTLQKEVVTSKYIAIENKINTFWHGIYNFIVNTMFNMCVFYLGDDDPEPEPEPEPEPGE